MMLNKEECEKALEVLECKAYDGCDKCYSQDEEFVQQEKEMYQYAQEHPNNQYVQDYIQSDDLPF